MPADKVAPVPSTLSERFLADTLMAGQDNDFAGGYRAPEKYRLA
ncbi:MAG: hypothetical protein WA702_13810 [Bradyrhizobium sp.]|jgi:hypothetical protein